MHFNSFLYNLLGAVISFITITPTSAAIESEPCKPGAKRIETDLRKRLENYHADYEYIRHFFFLPELLLPEEDTRHIGTTDRAYIYGQRHCAKRLTKKQLKKGIMYKSTCPWYVELTVNHDRYPTYMATTKCSCEHCYNDKGTKYRNETGAPVCREVKTRVKVLRQVFMEDPPGSKNWVPLCKNGVKDYTRSYEDVAIGCTCALPSSDHKINLFPYI